MSKLQEVFNVDVLVHWLATHGLRILVIAIGAFVAIKLIGFLTWRIEKAVEDDDPTTQSEREKRAATLGKIMRHTWTVLISVIAIMMVLKQVGIDIGPILAGVGIAGLAIGFGAQNLVKDVINGFFILLENNFRVGDVVKIGDVAGLVESMSLRVTVLRDLEGKVHVVPNGHIDVVTNMTKEWSRVVLDVGVAYKENVDHVMEVLVETGKDLYEDPAFRPLIMEPLEILGVDNFGDSSVDIKVMMKTLPLKQWAVGRELRRRIKKTFDEKGIEIPFPHRTLYMGEGENTGKLVVEAKTTGASTGAPAG
jgi:small-conductance mechanosensitive channel